MALSSDIKDLAIAFEGRKVGVSQTKDGIILRISIHPDECPTTVWRDWVGTRYQIAMVRIGDDEQPTAHDSVIIANKAIASAGMMCRDEAFQSWLAAEGIGGDIEVDVHDTERWAIDALRGYLGITSRTEMKTNKEALDKFIALRNDYMSSFDGT